MMPVIVVAHDPLATALIESASHVLGSQPEALLAIDVLADETAECLRTRLFDALACFPLVKEMVVLTDLYGATPSNVVLQSIDELTNVTALVVSGCNVPMLLRTLTYRDQSLQSLGEKIVMGGRNGIVSTKSSASQRQSHQSSKRHGTDYAHRDHHQ